MRHHILPLVMAAALAGCHTPTPHTAPIAVEGVVKVGTAPGGTHALRFLGADGKPIMVGQLSLGGQTFPIQNGAAQLPDALFQQAQRAGAVVLLVPGFLPVEVASQALAQGAVTLSPVTSLGAPVAVSATGAAASADGQLKLAFGQGMLPAASQVTLAAYRPELTAPTLTNAFKQDVAAVYRSAGTPAPAADACGSPFPCPPLQQALGIAVTADAAMTNGQVQVSVDLATFLRGWDGTSTPEPWVSTPGAWTADQIANARAAARILQTFTAVDATGDPALRAALQSQYGLALTGTMLTFPVTPPAGALAGGFLRLAVPGSELLGARLEVTLTTPTATVLPSGPGTDPAAAVTLANRTIAVPDPSGQTAVAARATLAPLAGARAGTTVQGGMPLVNDPVLAGASSTVLTGQPPGLVNNTPAVPLDATQVPGATTVLANNGSTLLSNNGSALTPGPIPGLLSNNGSAIVASADGQLLANNGSTLVPITGSNLIANNAGSLVTNTGGGGFTGYPYVPLQPELGKYELFGITVPTSAPPAVRVSPKGVREYLWPGGLKLRAIDVTGHALTGWSATDSDGAFNLAIQGQTPPVFFIEAVTVTGGVHLYSEVYAPGSQQGLIAVDSATSLMAISTLHLANFIPPETNRMIGVADGFQSALDTTNTILDQLKQSSKLYPVLTDQATLLTDNLMLAQARTSELQAADAAFRPNTFLADRQAAYGVIDAGTAKLATTSPATLPVYQQVYGMAAARTLNPQSLMPITLTSPF